MTRDFRQPSAFSTTQPQASAPAPAPTALPPGLRFVNRYMLFSAISLLAAGLWLLLAPPPFFSADVAGLLGPLFILVGILELAVIPILNKLARRMTPPSS